YGLREEGHESESDAMFFFKGVFILRAKIHNRLHVYFVKGSKHGRFIFHANEAFRDSFTQVSHLLTTLIPSSGYWSMSWGRSRLRLRRFSCRSVRLRFHGIFNRNTAVFNGSFDGGRVNAFFS